MKKIKSTFLKGDRYVLIFTFALCLFGLTMIFDASSISALRDFGNKFYYLEHQLQWFGIGTLSFLFFSGFDYKKLRKFALPAFLISLIFLVLVLIPGLNREIYGGKRWLQLGPIGFQPAELTKLTLIVYLSTLFEKKKEFLPFLSLVGVILGLLLLEPDLGTAVIIIATAVCLFFVSGAGLKELSIMGIASFLLAPVLVLFSPYRRERLFTFLNNSFDVQDSSYHVRQILIALGSGGIFGRGLGQSRQKFLFLPEASTDSIFAVIAEEFGFLGASFFISIFVFLFLKCLKMACRSKDIFGRLLVVGIIFCIGIQTLVNLAAMVSLVPLTGVPLPFISYGGSSLLISLTGMGIVYNISKSV